MRDCGMLLEALRDGHVTMNHVSLPSGRRASLNLLRLLFLYGACFLQHCSELSVLVHLHHRVAAADKLTVDVHCGGRARAAVVCA